MIIRNKMKLSKMQVHFSSKTDMWATPQDLFDSLNKKYKFNLDPCATKENAKCKKFFTEEENGLKKSWKGKRVFMNPPYGRGIGAWIKKASEGGGRDSRVLASCANRYKVVSRVHLQQSRNSIHQRSIKVWRTSKLCTISKHDSNI